MMILSACSKQVVNVQKLDPKMLSVGIQVRNNIKTFKVNQTLPFSVSIRNNSTVVIPSLAKADGTLKVNVAYHWLTADGAMYFWEGLRTGLPEDIKPEHNVDLTMKIKAPDKPGKYILVIDLVQEGVCWFKESGSQVAHIDMMVEN